MHDGVRQVGHGGQGFFQCVLVVAYLDQHAAGRDMLIIPSAFQAERAADALALQVQPVGQGLSNGTVAFPVGLDIIARASLPLPISISSRADAPLGVSTVLGPLPLE